MAHKLFFQREKYVLRDIQNSTRFDGWIKKLTFRPYQVRVLALIVIKRVFECCDPLIHYPIVLYLFFTFFGFETCNFAPFFNFYFFILAFVLTHESGPDKIQYRHVAEEEWMLSNMAGCDLPGCVGHVDKTIYQTKVSWDTTLWTLHHTSKLVRYSFFLTKWSSYIILCVVYFTLCYWDEFWYFGLIW